MKPYPIYLSNSNHYDYAYSNKINVIFIKLIVGGTHIQYLPDFTTIRLKPRLEVVKFLVGLES